MVLNNTNDIYVLKSFVFLGTVVKKGLLVFNFLPGSRFSKVVTS